MANDPSVKLTNAAKHLFKDLDNQGDSFAPYNFVQVMRKVFPMFDETDDKGHHKQQDAEECYTQFLSAFQNALKMGKKQDGDGDEMMDDEMAAKDPVERLFGIELESIFKNAESE